jgi:hypothetical protein
MQATADSTWCMKRDSQDFQMNRRSLCQRSVSDTIAPESPMLCFPILALIYKHIVLNNITKCIIRASIIGYDSPELSYNAIILKDWMDWKDIKLVLSAMASYCVKGKKGLLSRKEMSSFFFLLLLLLLSILYLLYLLSPSPFSFSPFSPFSLFLSLSYYRTVGPP